jgi:hypothetical protein
MPPPFPLTAIDPVAYTRRIIRGRTRANVIPMLARRSSSSTMTRGKAEAAIDSRYCESDAGRHGDFEIRFRAATAKLSL